MLTCVNEMHSLQEHFSLIRLISQEKILQKKLFGGVISPQKDELEVIAKACMECEKK
jgi:hypothetical protein